MQTFRAADGQDYYAVMVHPLQYTELLAIDARATAYLAAMTAGKNWRRAKREGRKAEEAVRRERHKAH